METVLTIFSLTLSIMIVTSIATTTYLIIRIKRNASIGSALALTVLSYAGTLVILVCGAFFLRQYQVPDTDLGIPPDTTLTPPSSEPPTDPPKNPPTNPPTDPPAPTVPPFAPKKTDKSDPGNWSIGWDVLVNNSVVDNYKRPEEIVFGDAESYTKLEGITTFRGDNYRTGATYGFSAVTDKTLTSLWRAEIGTFNGWPGAGWTGQPLVVRWDAETRAIMNLYEDKKAKDGLVEVIYATLDGFVRFYDLEDGSQTRDPLWIGMNFKGAGAIDPRGYPLLYIGSGLFVPDDDYSGLPPRMYIISLIDGSILYERSGADSAALRGWYAFDSAPLIHSETDTLIWLGENGIIYTIKLNSRFDKAAGTVTVNPDYPVKTRYSTNTGHSLGFESSPLVVDHYLFCGDNGGMFFCIDLNTMELIWAQNTFDDINATPIFRWEEDGKGYLYTATSMQYAITPTPDDPTVAPGDPAAEQIITGVVYIHKLDAATGEIVWERSFDNVLYNAGVSGGVLASPLLGAKGTAMENMIIYPIAKTPTKQQGLLLALDTRTGESIWERTMDAYTWSSPTAVYTENGTAYFILCDAYGYMHLIDPLTGKTLDKVGVGSNVEASPVVFENTVVVGTRGKRVYGIKIN